MKQAFLTILNMSITASYVILFVLFARVFLKKAPKIFSYALWSVALFRLICPFTFSSALSFFRFIKTRSIEQISANLSYTPQPQVTQVNGGINAVYNLANSSLPAQAPAGSIDPMQMIMFILSLLWITGVIALLIYSGVSYIRLKRKVSTAMLISDNIFRSENIKSPFVLGIMKPKIYLPFGLTENEEGYILNHEQIHIRRFDYLIKPFAFLVLCLHWFNPLVWISFVLMGHDMEMSCDEGVLKEMGKGIKKDYSSSLLALSIDSRMLSGSPLAFGESNAKGRIKNVLNYKRPRFWALAIGVILVGIVGIGLAANPREEKQNSSLLNISNVASEAKQREQVIFRANSSAGVPVAGSEFGGFLFLESLKWEEKKVPSALELAPNLTVYINIGSNYKLHFYESEPELAMVIYGGEHCYYKIPKDTYDKLKFMYLIRSYMIPGQVMRAIADGKITKKQSVQDVPNNGDYKVLNVSKENYYIYEKGGKYYVEQPYMFISEITEKVYMDAIEFASLSPADEIKVSLEMKNLVEDNIAIIMSSPQESSSLSDYIKANPRAYENIIKYGGEKALSYILPEFRKGNIGDDLRGQIMMKLCFELLGERNNVPDETLLPNEWFKKLSVRNKIELPDFTYEGSDPIQRLVYSTEIEKTKGTKGEFTIVAPHIFDSYVEGDRLKVFATTFSQRYFLYDTTLSEEGGSVIPVAITYEKDAAGNYTLKKYEQARDGSEFPGSIKEFCVMPQSGKKIDNLADKMLKHYGDYGDIIKLERENLIEHLKKCGLFGVSIIKKNYEKPDEVIPLT